MRVSTDLSIRARPTLLDQLASRACYQYPMWEDEVVYRPTTDFDRAVAAYIRGAAGQRKLNQLEVSERSGIPYSTFRRYWAGERSVTLGDFRAISKALDVDPEEAMKEAGRIFESGEYSD